MIDAPETHDWKTCGCDDCSETRYDIWIETL